MPVKVCMMMNSNVIGEQRVFKEARTLADAGYEVSILCNQPPDLDIPSIWDGIGIVGVHRRPSLLLPGKFTFEWLRTAFSLKPDIVHAHDLNTLGRALAVSRLTGAKLVYDSHDYFPETCTVLRMPACRRFYYRWKEKFLIRRADRVIYPTPGICRLAASRYRIPEPAWIANFPMGDASRPNRSLHEKFALPGNTRIVIYAGVLSLDRCLDRLVLSARHLPEDVAIVILGTGYLREKLGALVGEHGLANKVKFIDEFSFENNPTYLAAAALGFVLVQPGGLNFEHSWSTKVFDYLRAGLPVLYSGGPEVVRQIEENEVGRTFTDTSPEGVAAAIIGILDDKVNYEKYRENARKAWRGKFNWKSEGAKLLEIYDSL